MGNSGIIITGGTQNINQAVAGANAHAVMTTTSSAQGSAYTTTDLAMKIDELIAALKEKQSTVPNSTEVMFDAYRIASELKNEKPIASKIKSLLSIIQEGTKGISEVATIVSDVKAAADAVFG